MIDIPKVIDTFTETSDTTLASHENDTGYTWAVAGGAGTMKVDATNDRLIVNSGGLSISSVYAVGPTPSSANQYMQGTMVQASADDTHHFFLRLTTTGNDYYYFLRFSTSVLQIGKVVNGAAPVSIGTGTAPTNDSTVRFEVYGSIIKVYVNGNLRIKVRDTDVTAAGELWAIGFGQIFTAGDDMVDQILDDLEAGELTLDAEFFDNFYEADTTELSTHTPDVGSSWTEVLDVGTVQMDIETTLSLEANGGLSDGSLYKANKSTSWLSNQAAETQVRDPDSSDDSTILAVRIVDSNNFYALRFNADVFRIYKKTTAGGVVALGTELGAGQVAIGNKVRLEVQGTTLKAFVNDSELISLTDSDISSGSPGLGAGAVLLSGDDMSSQSFWDFYGYDLVQTYTKTVTAKGNILILYTKTLTVKGRIEVGNIETINSKGRIEKQFSKTIIAKARIGLSPTKTIVAKADIYKLQSQIISAKGVVGTYQAQTITTKGNIRSGKTKTLQSKGKIELSYTKTITSKGRVEIFIQKTVSAKSRIEARSTQVISAKSSIKNVMTAGQIYYLTNLWDIRYEANALPQNSTPAWTKTDGSGGSATEAAVGGILTVTGEADDEFFYQLADSSFDNSVGTTVEVRTRIVNATPYGGGAGSYLEFTLRDGTYSQDIIFDEVSVRLSEDDTDPYLLDATQWHTYRLTLKETSLKLYVDGVLRIQKTVATEGTEKNLDIYFWDSVGWEQDYDYFYYRTDGAFPPLDLASKARIEQENSQEIQAKANLLAFKLQNITAKARILGAFYQRVDAKSRIEKQFQKTLQSKAQILRIHTESINAKARIKQSRSKTINAKANIILYQVSFQISAKANILARKTRTIRAKGYIYNPFELFVIDKPTFGGIEMPFPDEARIQPLWTSAENLPIGGKTSLDVMARKYQYIMGWNHLKVDDYNAIEAVVNALVPATFVYQKWPQSVIGVSCLGSLSSRRLEYGTGKVFFLSSVTLTLIEVENRI